jgi:hypothetical protein
MTLFSLLWPRVDTLASARAATRIGFVACSTLVILNIAVVTYAMPAGYPAAKYVLAYLGPVIFAILSCGIWFMSRVAAVVAFGLVVFEMTASSFHDGLTVSLLISMVLFPCFVSALRGSFAFHRLSKIDPRGIIDEHA